MFCDAAAPCICANGLLNLPVHSVRRPPLLRIPPASASNRVYDDALNRGNVPAQCFVMATPNVVHKPKNRCWETRHSGHEYRGGDRFALER